MSEFNLKKNEAIKGWAKHHFTTEVNSGFERLTAPASSHGISAILVKLYKKDEEGHKKALQRHLMFYNSETTWGSVIFGMTCALEEERAIMLQEGVGSEELEASADMISSLKVGLTGSLAGIGNTINHGMLRPLLLSMFTPPAAEGSWPADVGPLLIWGIAITFLAYTLVTKGYTLGRKSVVPILKSDKLNQFIKTASVLSLPMMGALSSIYVKLITPISWANVAGERQLLQDVLSKIFPNILSLLIMLGVYFYIKKSGPKYVRTLVSILVLSVVLSLFGTVQGGACTKQKQWTDLNNGVVIAIGDAMGIGEAMVKDLLACNARIAIFDLTKSKGFSEDDRRVYMHLDIQNKKEVEAAVDAVVQRSGTVGVLANDAGVARPRILVDYYSSELQYELSEEDFDFMVGVNRKGTFLISQVVTRVLYGKKEGVIINLSSCAGLMGSRGYSCYSAIKAVAHALTISWAKELGLYNICVIGVASDTLDRTPANNDKKYRAQVYGCGWDANIRPEEFFKNYKPPIPLGRPSHLYEVADLICYLISDHASYITGVTTPVSGGKSKGQKA